VTNHRKFFGLTFIKVPTFLVYVWIWEIIAGQNHW